MEENKGRTSRAMKKSGSVGRKLPRTLKGYPDRGIYEMGKSEKEEVKKVMGEG